MTFSGSIVEDAALAWPEALGYAVARGPGIAADEPGEAISTPEDIFGTAPAISAPSSPDLDGRRNAEGCLLSDWLPIGKPDVECYVTESAP
jgi:hypothetical protein